MSGAASARWVVVVLESVVSGHTATWVRAPNAPKVEKFLHDPRLERTVLFKETKRIRTKKDLKSWQKNLLGL